MIGDIPVRLDSSGVYSDIPGGYALGVSLAENIRTLRRAADLTQTKLGRRVGVGQGAVSKWESGESEPDASLLPKLAAVLKTSLDRILQGVEAEYDAIRDLSSHGRTGQQTPQQPGESDVPASAVARDTAGRLAESERRYRELAAGIRLLAGELIRLVAGDESAPARTLKPKTRGRHRRVG